MDQIILVTRALCIRLELAKRCGLCGICKICAYSLIVSKSEYDIQNSEHIEWRLCMTRFQLILPVQSQNVTKNRTDHRMHVEGIQICQINGWNNSFQNMCSINRQKLTVWPGKSILWKKTPQERLFLCARI